MMVNSLADILVVSDLTTVVAASVEVASSAVSGTGAAADAVVVQAYRNTAFTLTTSGQVLAFNDERIDTDNAYNTTTGVFTAPRDGVYQINAGWYSGGVPASECGYIAIYKGGAAHASN